MGLLDVCGVGPGVDLAGGIAAVDVDAYEEGASEGKDGGSASSLRL
jgi:hypothetical protein